MSIMTSQNLEFWIHQKYKNLNILRKKHFFFLNKKIRLVHIKGYNMARNSFLEKITFKFHNMKSLKNNCRSHNWKSKVYQLGKSLITFYEKHITNHKNYR